MDNITIKLHCRTVEELEGFVTDIKQDNSFVYFR